MLDAYLEDCRNLVLEEIERTVPKDPRYRTILYDLMLDYPRRRAKALRPALLIATARALGGTLEGVLRTAAVLELYHNAFLIHDDVEDGSLLRRGRGTMHVEHGVPIAVNVGDAILALALQPLLDNMEILGLGKAIRVMQIVARMARESAEGQALELDWIRRSWFDLRDADYVRMVYKKTCWYTFIAPIVLGATIAGAGASGVAELRRFAGLVGIAFQIQDDMLNLVPDEGGYGKEFAGDLYEGKHTLMILHVIRSAAPSERAVLESFLRKERADRTADEVAWILGRMEHHGSLAHARAIAGAMVDRAGRALSTTASWMPASAHRAFLEGITNYVVDRAR